MTFFRSSDVVIASPRWLLTREFWSVEFVQSTLERVDDLSADAGFGAVFIGPAIGILSF